MFAAAAAAPQISRGEIVADAGRLGGFARLVQSRPGEGVSQAVVVDQTPLVHIEQTEEPILIQGAAESFVELAAAQVDFGFKQMSKRLAAAGASFDDVIKFNFYLGRDPAVAAAVAERLKTFYSNEPPAVTFMVGSAQSGCTADCIAVYRKPIEPGKVVRFDGAAVLPPTNQLYVSGDAVPGALMSVVGDTLASLEKTLVYCGLDWSHVVQLKTFMQPISAASDVRREIRTWFGSRPVPVLSFVEWQSSEKIPIEIELIAAVPPELGNKSGDAVEYLTPPHMKSSPVFSRAARLRSDSTIYTSNVYGDSAEPDDQVRAIFGKLKTLLDPLGGDLRHLVKATYYVTDDGVSKALGTIRPEFYDPQRPPAASKALVTGTGRANRTVTLDMIAVPR
jgi:enamine deaminase RidA (YjgF/YER057c/UK114 family)